MPDQSKKIRRSRGVLLSERGWKRLSSALAQQELVKNNGHPYSLEKLSELTNLSPHTLIKVRRRSIPVDRQTLTDYFSALQLELTSDDYVKPTLPSGASHPTHGSSLDSTDDPSLTGSNELPSQFQSFSRHRLFDEARPEGQLPLDSSLYIKRPLSEMECYRTIEQPGALIRIKAPRRMGKTSLVARVLDHARQKGYKALSLSFQLAERELMRDLTRFLQWFSVSVGRGLEMPNQLTDYWDDMFGSKMSCKIYFEQYLLANQAQPVVLGLDDVDRLFQYPDLADEFFGLLRTWHEESKNRDIWKRLRLIVAHSTEVYIPLNVNKSPFNVGLPVVLGPFDGDQIEALAQCYRIEWSQHQTQQLMALTNGHPYLVQLALYALWKQDLALEDVLDAATAPTGIYSDHLQRQYWLLEQDAELGDAFTQVLNSTEPVSLDLPQAFRLESMGLVRVQDNQVMPHCSLYNQYFRDRFSLSTP